MRVLGKSIAPIDVLLVEDEPIQANAFARSLKRKWTAVVVVARDGRSAKQELSEREFDLVIADIGLPDVSGIDVLQDASEINPAAYRAVLTGSSDRELVQRVEMLDAFFMTKPAESEVIGEVMMRTERRRRRRRILDDLVERNADAWKLSPREQQILIWLLNLGTPAAGCRVFDIGETTFDSHVKNIRAKLGGESLARTVQRLLLEVIEAGE